jgi:hemerythrin-like domain-containing protein
VDIYVPLKREHMYKEDNILYPAAIEAIKEQSVWDNLTMQCRDIGYNQY